jgi:hypothetical protein
MKETINISLSLRRGPLTVTECFFGFFPVGLPWSALKRKARGLRQNLLFFSWRGNLEVVKLPHRAALAKTPLKKRKALGLRQIAPPLKNALEKLIV